MTETLVRFFAREPFHQWMVPDPKRWAERAPRYFRTYIKMILRDGCTDTANDGAATALARAAKTWRRRVKPHSCRLLWRLAGVKFKEVWEVISSKTAPKNPIGILICRRRSQSRAPLGSALLQYGLA